MQSAVSKWVICLSKCSVKVYLSDGDGQVGRQGIGAQCSTVKPQVNKVNGTKELFC